MNVIKEMRCVVNIVALLMALFVFWGLSACEMNEKAPCTPPNDGFETYESVIKNDEPDTTSWGHHPMEFISSEYRGLNAAVVKWGCVAENAREVDGNYPVTVEFIKTYEDTFFYGAGSKKYIYIPSKHISEITAGTTQLVFLASSPRFDNGSSRTLEPVYDEKGGVVSYLCFDILDGKIDVSAKNSRKYDFIIELNKYISKEYPASPIFSDDMTIDDLDTFFENCSSFLKAYLN